MVKICRQTNERESSFRDLCSEIKMACSNFILAFKFLFY